MLPPQQPPEYAAFRKRALLPSENVRPFARHWNFHFLPLGFFSRLMVRILNMAYISKTTPTAGSTGSEASGGVSLSGLWKSGLLVATPGETALLEFDPVKNILLLALHSKNHGTQLLVRLVQAVESLVDVFYSRESEGLLLDHRLPYSVLIKCTHCLAKRDDMVLVREFAYEDLVQNFLAGRTTVPCGGVPVPLDDLVPDVILSHLPVLENLTDIEPIGEGGFGVVWRATLPGVGPVALKELKLDPTHSPEEKLMLFKRFHHEVFIMSRFQHPQLVRLYGITLAPKLALAMEFLPVDSLSVVAHNRSKYPNLSLYMRLKLALDVAQGMQCLHALRPPIIHRDLRTQNVFVASLDEGVEVNAVVGDFGLAQFVVPAPKQFLGSWFWLAPETLRASSDYFIESDVYSFGIILWELLSRSVPFSEYEEYVTRRSEKLSPEVLGDAKRMAEFRALGYRIEGDTIFLEEYRKQDIIEAIVTKNLRPTLPTEAPLAVAQLLARAWAPLPADRPNFDQIVTILRHEVAALAPRLAQSPVQPLAAESPVTLASSPPRRLSRSFSENRRSTMLSTSPLSTSPAATSTALPLPKNSRPQLPVELIWRKAIPEFWHLALRTHGSVGSLWLGTRDGSLQILEPRSLAVQGQIMKAHTRRVYGLVECGDRLWTCSEDHEVAVWNGTTLLRDKTFAHHTALIKSIALVHDGSFNLKTDAYQVWTGDVAGKICAFDAHTQELWCSFQLTQLASSKQPACSLAFVRSRDPRIYPHTVWIGSLENIYVIDPAERRLLAHWRAHSGLVNFILPWRDHVWTAADDGIKVWTKRRLKATGRPEMVREIRAHSGRVLALAKLSAPGSQAPHIWSASWDKSVLIFDARTFECLQELRVHEDGVRAIIPVDRHTAYTGSLDNSIAAWHYR